MDNEAQALAEAQAEKDRALLAKLQEKQAAVEQEPITIITDDPDATEESIVQPRIPMNRAERRQQVAYYARLLAETERQTPVRNSTIIPRSERRRRKGQRGRLQHA